MKFGFTKAPGHYTHSTDRVDAAGKPLWQVLPVPRWWPIFGRPTRRDGEEGYISRPMLFPVDSERPRIVQFFYPLAVLHNLRL